MLIYLNMPGKEDLDVRDFYAYTTKREGKQLLQTGKSVDSVLRNTLAIIQRSLADSEFDEACKGYVY
jgi:hypothetical protein